jgi:ubiquinone/menaquinone biosynthesis C-methylase UbiE
LAFYSSHFKGGEKNMDRVEYKNFYDKVGKLNGWDFSKLQVVSEGEQWDFYNEVTQRCKKSDLLLDIGTGGGERLLAFTDSAILLVGIDHTNGMIQTANANLRKAKKQNVRFLLMDAENIEFSSSFFNVVSCRHSNFYAKEVPI